MGVDYVIDLPCAPKAALGGAQQLVALVKQRGQAESLLQLARTQGDTRAPDEITFQSAVMRPTGVEEREVSLQTLFDASAPLAAHERACQGCPANCADRAFGCYGYIAYPVPAAAEKWLLGRLPRSLSCTAGHMLVKALGDFGWNGEHVAQMRAQGGTFFEARERIVATWGEGRKVLALDSDTLLEMVLFVGHVQPSHALMLSLFLGLLPHDLEVSELQQILQDPERMKEAVELPVHEDAAIAPLCAFLKALATAAWLDKNLLIDG
jgi:hypothetical protein